MSTATEIKPGMRIRFMNGDIDPVVGVTNGTPFVWFDGIDAVAMIPVYVHDSDKCIVVDGRNVMAVGEFAPRRTVEREDYTGEHSVKA